MSVDVEILGHLGMETGEDRDISKVWRHRVHTPKHQQMTNFSNLEITCDSKESLSPTRKLVSILIGHCLQES